MYGVLKNCGSVIVICEYNGDVGDVNGNLKKRECNCEGTEKN